MEWIDLGHHRAGGEETSLLRTGDGVKVSRWAQRPDCHGQRKIRRCTIERKVLMKVSRSDKIGKLV